MLLKQMRGLFIHGLNDNFILAAHVDWKLEDELRKQLVRENYIFTAKQHRGNDDVTFDIIVNPSTCGKAYSIIQKVLHHQPLSAKWILFKVSLKRWWYKK